MRKKFNDSFKLITYFEKKRLKKDNYEEIIPHNSMIIIQIS